MARSASSSLRSPLPALLAAGMLLLLASTLRADTDRVVPAEKVPSCYCGCSASQSRGGCVKMCELKKYSARWWATSCAKPRLRPPADTHGAGPRFPHPGRAERASNDARPAPGAHCPPDAPGKRR